MRIFKRRYRKKIEANAERIEAELAAGVKSRNEIRAEFGMSPLTGSYWENLGEYKAS